MDNFHPISNLLFFREDCWECGHATASVGPGLNLDFFQLGFMSGYRIEVALAVLFDNLWWEIEGSRGLDGEEQEPRQD